MVVVQRDAHLLEVVDALDAPRGFASRLDRGQHRAMSTAMIAMTTRSSIKVKPRRCFITDVLQDKSQALASWWRVWVGCSGCAP